MHVTTRLTTLTLAVLIASTSAAYAGESQLSREQTGCVVAVNKAFARVVKVAGKASARCAGSETTPIGSCLTPADTAPVEAKTANAIAKKCDANGVDANSTIGFVGDSNTVNDAARGEMFALAEDLVGAALPATSEAGRCQRVLVKGSSKLAGVLAKETVKRKKSALGGKLGAPPETSEQLGDELAAAGLSAKAAKATTRLAAKLAKKCTGLDLAALFPNECAEAASTTELAECADAATRCRFCQALNAADGLAIDCAGYSGLATCDAGDGVCGDGETTGLEQCDDGNTTSGDGCDEQCLFESVCGDGETTGLEQCDDGNTTSDDGCSSACVIEEMHVCGDGATTGAEECDDGNTTSGDGCSDECAIEITLPFCGDGVLDEGEGEQCDDGNTGSGDGCDESCIVEVCGNGVLQTGETCDDGNTSSGDGCDGSCQLEVAAVCGNGVPESPEECDDGNTAPGDGCDENCLIEVVEPFCGDGNLDDGEECDDGNTLDGDSCEADCTFPDQVAPEDARFNNPLDIPLDTTVSVLDFVSFPNGDTQDMVRYDVIGMNPTPSLPGGQARLIISVSCFGENTDQVEIFTGGQTFACGDTVVDREVTAASDTGTITLTAVGGDGTYVQWVLTGTATRLN